jgi:hypothetical protein
VSLPIELHSLPREGTLTGIAWTRSRSSGGGVVTARRRRGTTLRNDLLQSRCDVQSAGAYPGSRPASLRASLSGTTAMLRSSPRAGRRSMTGAIGRRGRYQNTGNSATAGSRTSLAEGELATP